MQHALWRRLLAVRPSKVRDPRVSETGSRAELRSSRKDNVRYPEMRDRSVVPLTTSAPAKSIGIPGRFSSMNERFEGMGEVIEYEYIDGPLRC